MTTTVDSTFFANVTTRNRGFVSDEPQDRLARIDTTGVTEANVEDLIGRCHVSTARGPWGATLRKPVVAVLALRALAASREGS